LVVPFENGMSHLDRLNKRFGRPAVLGGVVKVAITLDERGSIVRLAPWASLTIGAQPAPQLVEVAEVAAAAVRREHFCVSANPLGSGDDPGPRGIA
jgi:2-dehydropantoate 2-reductase